jgi:signal peptidase II
MIIICAVSLDQFVKRAVTARFAGGGEARALVRGLIDVVYLENEGAAFNLLQGKRVFLVAFTFLMIAALIVYIVLKRKSESPVTLTGLALVAGGGLGNLIDRVRLGYVVDYIEFKPFSFPVFNIADILVCAGCGLFFIYFAAAELRARGGRPADGRAE